MIDFLLGVPGKLAAIYTHLTSYLSSTRAAKIDNLDTTISSRAAASTALSNATWTDARAGYLDKLNMTGAILSIKSIQYGTATIAVTASTGAATITAVDVSKTVLFHLGSVANNSAAALNDVLAHLTLTDSTTVTATRSSSSASYQSQTRFVAVEFC